MSKNIGKTRGFSRRVGQSTQTVKLATKKSKFESDDLESWQYLEQREIQALFGVIKSRRDRAIFRLTYHHGLRASELGALEMERFRDRDGALFIYRGKGSKSREHGLVKEELKALRAFVREERGTAPGPIFVSRQGGPITRSRLDQLMKQYCKLAGIAREKAHMHALKHSCGTHLAELGLSAAEIQDWLGHIDSKSTDIYMHMSAQRRKAVLNKTRDWR